MEPDTRYFLENACNSEAVVAIKIMNFFLALSPSTTVELTMLSISMQVKIGSRTILIVEI